ncbi:MAG: glutamate synthase subunit alpha [Succinivibrio sp.]|nr:glutamate synthase subunit alpha [Succinivibrio sp.]
MTKDKDSQHGLYRSENEHDACGVGFIVDIKGRRSHSIVSQGLEILRNLTHRGAVGADPLQGDGAGILLQIPDELYRQELKRDQIDLPPIGEYGVGMIFLPKEAASRHACEEEIERAVLAEGQVILGWRDVPVNTEQPMSPQVKEKEPVIRQIFVGHSSDVLVTDALERKLYIIRKRSSIAIQNLHLKHCKEFYIPSFSARTVVYKGQLLASQIEQYFRDLDDARCTSALAVIHQRFSTNTFPQWSLAHPFRMVAHNGEINTLRGNFNWIKAREKQLSSVVLGTDLEKLWPLIFKGQSDSASFDNVLELLTMAGYPLCQAIMMMIPSAWEKDRFMDSRLKAFYEFHAAMMEPWDGPAAVVFTDGRQIGATLDRNGLRPARYLETRDGRVILASEEGVLKIDEHDIVRHQRIEPGRMLLIDTEQGRIIPDAEIKNQIASARPYQEWVNKVKIRISDIQGAYEKPEDHLSLPLLLGVFGYTQESIDRLLSYQSEHGQEPILSMGNDTPLAVLSGKPKPLYNYFRQLFAQVTNPPIDPIREDLVTSLLSFVGPRPNLLNVMDTNPTVRLEVEQPVLDAEDMEKIRHIASYTGNKFRTMILDITYPLKWGSAAIEARLASILAQAVEAVHSGVNILIISDRNVSSTRVAIPALLATSAVHQCLVEHGLRTSTGLIVETGSAFEVHHFALLGGYGAEAVHPYVALSLVASLAPKSTEQAKYVHNYIESIDHGLYKTMAKMGICTYMSYIGAQIFEAVGLSEEFVERYFTNTPTAVGGIGLFEVAEEAVKVHNHTFSGADSQDYLQDSGDFAWRHGGEEHMWTPDAVVHLQRAVRNDDYAEFKRYAEIINDQHERHMTLRGLMTFAKTSPIALDEVESEESIIRRFTTSAMSQGAISTEAHTAIAIAMNRLGAMSNSGEGGEDPRRSGVLKEDSTTTKILGRDILFDYPLKKGDSLASKVRQVASGRFGVTSDYLADAEIIQIKMAQGAKPGEGGQLPGHKVSPYIGMLRHSLPGVGLISPPPHHDIYSIEDLSQLIFDLKLANTRADISVKLVSEVGIGTVAAGVAKCKADQIVISGHDGGTGAAPASSLMHAGTAWEVGLSEVQQTLVLNRLRSRVRLQVDGQLKTGRDVVIGALLGADEFGFATAPLVCLGCTMMRKCHNNTCPAGIATQDERLRRQFTGRPEHLMNFYHFIAREVREIMAELGVRKFEDLIGHVELLKANGDDPLLKQQGLNFEHILYQDESLLSEPRLHQTAQDHELDKAFDLKFMPRLEEYLDKGPEAEDRLEISSEICNVNRSIGTMLSGYVASRKVKLADKSICLKLTGTAGQSLGAFLDQGLYIRLEGQANDYVGKGLSGGIIAIRQGEGFLGKASENMIGGNTCLYGATSGQAYFAGRLGERFAVRNSGATAVCEGLGDHGLEYMTGGTVVILGSIGRNFAAGMSGGAAYLYKAREQLEQMLDSRHYEISQVLPDSEVSSTYQKHLGTSDEQILSKLLQEHAELTDSETAKSILKDFKTELKNFVRVCPREYLAALAQLEKGE